jgi:hypothetical protein
MTVLKTLPENLLAGHTTSSWYTIDVFTYGFTGESTPPIGRNSACNVSGDKFYLPIFSRGAISATSDAGDAI